jgi:hypothetical protein
MISSHSQTTVTTTQFVALLLLLCDSLTVNAFSPSRMVPPGHGGQQQRSPTRRRFRSGLYRSMHETRAGGFRTRSSTSRTILRDRVSPDDTRMQARREETTFTGEKPFVQAEEFPEMKLEMIPMKKSDVSNQSDGGSGLLWRGVVVILCALWASNFAAAKLIMGEPGVDSSLYTVSRFTVAALALLPGSVAAIKRGVIDWETAKGAAVCGSWVSFGYLGQTLGLLTTTASRSCVICTLHCVFVAAVAELMRVSRSAGKKSFDALRLVPAAVAVTGVAIVELKGAGVLRLWEICCPLPSRLGLEWVIFSWKNWSERSQMLVSLFLSSSWPWLLCFPTGSLNSTLSYTMRLSLFGFQTSLQSFHLLWHWEVLPILVLSRQPWHCGWNQLHSNVYPLRMLRLS